MKRPEPEVVKALAALSRQYPDFLTWLRDWRQLELDALPYNGQNMAVAQGRCQVLSELVRLATDAPELAAKSKQGSLF